MNYASSFLVAGVVWLLSGSLGIAQDAPEGAASTNPTSSSSSIDQVTVFEDRARVDRTQPATLVAGVNRIEFTELPISLDPSSAWVELSGIGANRLVARVLGVHLNRVVHEEDIRAQVASLETEWDAISLRDRMLVATRLEQSKRGELAQQFSNYLRTAMLERSTRTDPLETEKLIEAEEWVSEQSLAVESTLARLARERSELQRRLHEVQENLARMKAGAGRVTFTAVVQIESTEGGEAILRLGYDVADARWRPVYEARLDESSRTVIWSYGAEIEQRSGEDWGGVALVLSTQRSSLGLAPPTLVPMQVGGYEVGRRSAGLVSREATGSAAAAPSEESQRDSGDLSSAEIEGAGAVVRFRVPVRASIPTDGRPHRVPILESTLPADLAFECVPRLSPHTYRRGKMVNRSEAPFLPGTVRVFREGAFVGSTELKAVPAGGSFSLSFGVDGRIVARRTELVDRERIVGTFQKGQRRTLGYEFAVRNMTPEPVTLSLLDQVPVSEIEGVEVKPTKACAPVPEVDADGICRWQLELPSGSMRTVVFEYEVTVARGVDFPVESVE